MIGRVQFLKTLRWHHLGFSFAWASALVGISYLGPTSNYESLLSLLQLSFITLGVIVAGKREKNSFTFNPISAYICAALLAFGELSYFAAFYIPDLKALLLALGVVLTGCSLGAVCTLWQCFFASEGEGRTGVIIPLSGVFSILLSLALGAIPFAVSVVMTVAVFPLLAALSLAKCLKEMIPYIDSNRKIWSLDDAVASIVALRIPILCCCLGSFCWSLCSNGLSLKSVGLQSSSTLGDILAALFVTCLLLFTIKKVYVGNVVRALSPFVMCALLLALILGGATYDIAAALLIFLSETSFLLTQYAICDYTSEKGLPAAPVYATCMVPTYLSMLLGNYLGLARMPVPEFDSYAADAVLGLSALLILLLVLAIPNKNRISEKSSIEASSSSAHIESTNPSDTTPGNPTENEPHNSRSAHTDTAMNASLSSRTENDPLTAREFDVALLAMHGYSVDAISKRLFISNNTTRSHLKSIYRKANVHSRQELIDLLDSQSQ